VAEAVGPVAASVASGAGGRHLGSDVPVTAGTGESQERAKGQEVTGPAGRATVPVTGGGHAMAGSGLGRRTAGGPRG
jgi:hypothetical protein